MLTLGQFLRKERLMKGYSSTAIAELMDIPYPSYYKYENDATVPRETTLQKIADYYNVKIDELRASIPQMTGVSEVVEAPFVIPEKIPEEPICNGIIPKPINLLLSNVYECQSTVNNVMTGDSIFEKAIKAKVDAVFQTVCSELQKIVIVDEGF